MTQITVIVAPDGTTTIRPEGFSGPACQAATRGLEEVLGVVRETRKTPEYYQDAQQAQRASQGR